MITANGRQVRKPLRNHRKLLHRRWADPVVRPWRHRCNSPSFPFPFFHQSQIQTFLFPSYFVFSIWFLYFITLVLPSETFEYVRIDDFSWILIGNINTVAPWVDSRLFFFFFIFCVNLWLIYFALISNWMLWIDNLSYEFP